ncbi:MAG: hypothetical protein LBU15_03275 [Rickettsiales bacterium]|jgi:predicted transposase/invertase (TIGR01784 family)|nr:hypothetical protein [Rickettsiales bacterium]
MAELKRLSSDRTARALYEAELRAENDRIADNASALKRGISEGMEKGMMKGINKGKMETALAMLRKGLGVNLVAECAGLPEREVLRLAEDLEK